MKRVVKEREREREVEVRAEDGGRYEVVIDGEALALVAESLGDGRLRLQENEHTHMARVTRAGSRVYVSLADREFVFEVGPAARRARRDEHHAGAIAMPMPGLVVRVHVQEGERVTRGQPLVVVEAMKMEHTLRAPRDGVVRRLAAQAGSMIDAGAELLAVEA